MSKSKSEISITKRSILELVRYKTRNNYIFFGSNEYIAKALDITTNSAKTLINTLVRDGYLNKTQDKMGRRVLTITDKPYLRLFEDFSGLDKKVLKLERDDAERDSLYYSAQLNGAELRVNQLNEELTDMKFKNVELSKQITTLKERLSLFENFFKRHNITGEEMEKVIVNG